MKLKDVLFRKMTLLYVAILFFLGLSFFVSMTYFIDSRNSIEMRLSSEPLIMVETEKPITNFVEATSTQQVKRLREGIFYLKADKTLKGNECKTNVLRASTTSVGSTLNPLEDSDFSCTIVGYNSGIITEILVSQETFDAYEPNINSFIVTVESLKDYNKLVKKYDAYVLITIPERNFTEDYISMNYYLYTSVLVAAIIALIIVVIYMNTRGYIKHNTKKSKKKKADDSTKVLVINTLLTTIVPLALSYFLAYYYIADIIYNLG